jgi:hypothetical protein
MSTTTIPSDKVISTILKHDSKVTSYKIALLRSINDVVLAFPDIQSQERDVAVPLRMLAEFWIAYYWPFADELKPILQGQQARRDGQSRNDIAFRPALTFLRREWEHLLQFPSLPSDGFFLISEFKTPRRRATYPASLQKAYDATVVGISRALIQPLRYAGPGQWMVFDKPQTLKDFGASAVPLPGTGPEDVCVLVRSALWQSFRALSLWIEALSIHEWCLFSERITREHVPREHVSGECGGENRVALDEQEKENQISNFGDDLNSGIAPNSGVDRGHIYSLLTARPHNRRPLTWERNHIEVLMFEGVSFVCPWTRKVLAKGADFDLDHLLPLAIYPVNELWNLLPADSDFNQHTKRDRIPASGRLIAALPLIAAAYGNYDKSAALQQAVREDASVRFSGIPSTPNFAGELAKRAVHFLEEVAGARSVARF